MARKKKGLPFVVQPRLEPVVELIGSPESGQIEIERRGYLTVAEKAFIQGTTGDDTSISDLHKLARKVSRETGANIQEIVDPLLQGDTSGVLAPYEDEVINLLTALGQSNERQSMLIATCLLMFRVDMDWTLEQTAELHPDLVEALVGLYKDEDARSLKALEESAKVGKVEQQDNTEGKS